ncbi:hypothetical protein CSPX01_13965, partial [Colletotrichum filicis]
LTRKDSVQCLGYDLLDWANISETPIKRFCWQLCSVLKSHRSIINTIRVDLGRKKPCSSHIISCPVSSQISEPELVNVDGRLSGKRVPEVSYSLCLFSFPAHVADVPWLGPCGPGGDPELRGGGFSFLHVVVDCDVKGGCSQSHSTTTTFSSSHSNASNTAF